MEAIYQRKQEAEYDRLSVGARVAWAFEYTWFHTPQHVRLAMSPAPRLTQARVEQLLSELLREEQ